LQAHCKKVEEQLINVKQENAQLRKKLSKDGSDGSDIHTNKEVDEKMKKLRKRNTELVSLAKQLDERCKALKMENEQLVCGHQFIFACTNFCVDIILHVLIFTAIY